MNSQQATTSYSKFCQMNNDTGTQVARIQKRLNLDGLEVTADVIEHIASDTQESIANDCKGDVMSSEWSNDGFWECVEETVRANI
ncbi:TPA: hypothetical protein ACMDS1_003642 [Vibrio parahaemolyticus]|nr:hypothetical protein [Vibrio parahaemolyticus]